MLLSPLARGSSAKQEESVRRLRETPGPASCSPWQALLRAWVPTWRFFDAPDLTLELRAHAGAPWLPLTVARRFRVQNLFVAPALVDQMWREGRVRAWVEHAQEAGYFSADAYRVLGELLVKLMAHRNPSFPALGWSLRSLDAMTGEVCVVIHCPLQGALQC